MTRLITAHETNYIKVALVTKMDLPPLVVIYHKQNPLWYHRCTIKVLFYCMTIVGVISEILIQTKAKAEHMLKLV